MNPFCSCSSKNRLVSANSSKAWGSRPGTSFPYLMISPISIASASCCGHADLWLLPPRPRNCAPHLPLWSLGRRIVWTEGSRCGRSGSPARSGTFLLIRGRFSTCAYGRGWISTACAGSTVGRRRDPRVDRDPYAPRHRCAVPGSAAAGSRQIARRRAESASGHQGGVDGQESVGVAVLERPGPQGQGLHLFQLVRLGDLGAGAPYQHAPPPPALWVVVVDLEATTACATAASSLVPETVRTMIRSMASVASRRWWKVAGRRLGVTDLTGWCNRISQRITSLTLERGQVEKVAAQLLQQPHVGGMLVDPAPAPERRGPRPPTPVTGSCTRRAAGRSPWSAVWSRRRSASTAPPQVPAPPSAWLRRERSPPERRERGSPGAERRAPAAEAAKRSADRGRSGSGRRRTDGGEPSRDGGAGLSRAAAA